MALTLFLYEIICNWILEDGEELDIIIFFFFFGGGGGGGG